MRFFKPFTLGLLFFLTTLAFPWGSELCQGCRLDSSALAGPIYTFPGSQLFQQMISTNGTFLFQDAIDRLPAYSNGVKLEIRTQSKSPLRLAYDVDNYVDFSVGLTGSLTINATGGVVISPNGNVVISNGNLGIGTTSPVVALDVNGGIKIGSVSDCTADKAGTLRWFEGHISVCTGTAWRQLDNPPPPLIGSIIPAFGQEATVITISGTGFAPGLRVTIGDVVATNVTCISATQITATVPASSTSGAKDVVITNFDTGAAVKAAGFTYSVYATGGTITSPTIGGIVYRVHTFTDSGTFTVNTGGNLEYLVVGGGGAGGDDISGGGGGGGFLTGTTGVIIQNYTVIVGAGGAATTGTESTGLGNNGSSSSFSSIIALGGGAGGGEGQPTGASGASGGGGGISGAGGAGTQGYSGGNAIALAAGGGGGAGGAGLNGANPYGGNGGPGLLSTIDGNSYYYAGGGGGNGWSQASYGGNGGSGGGGGSGGVNSTYINPGVGNTQGRNNGLNGNIGASGKGGNAGANTGGGGGGAGETNWQYQSTSGSGGSGIVIIRYPISQ